MLSILNAALLRLCNTECDACPCPDLQHSCHGLQTRGFDEPFFLPVHPRGRLQAPMARMAPRRAAIALAAMVAGFHASRGGVAEGLLQGCQTSLAPVSARFPRWPFQLGPQRLSRRFSSSGPAGAGAGAVVLWKCGACSALSRSSRGTGLVPGRCMRAPQPLQFGVCCGQEIGLVKAAELG